MQDRLFIFLHIPRTGGTTLVRHIEHKFKKEERLRLYFKELDLIGKKKKFTKNDYQKIVKKHIISIPLENRKKIKIIYGHRVPYGIEKFFNKKPYYFTFLRNPLDRVVSAFNLWNTSYHLDNLKNRRSELYKLGYLVNGNVPNFREWFLDKSKKLYYTNFGFKMTNMFTKLGYSQNDDFVLALHRFDFIGIKEKLHEDLPYIFNILKINKFFLNQNASKSGVMKSALPNSFLKLMEDYYKNDTHIYNQALKLNARFKNEDPEFFKKVNNVNLKRNILLPFTQFYYYPLETLRLIKHNLIK